MINITRIKIKLNKRDVYIYISFIGANMLIKDTYE